VIERAARFLVQADWFPSRQAGVRSSNAAETAAIERNGPIVRSSLTVVHLIEKSSGDRAQHADIRSSQTLLVQAFSFLS